MTTSDNQLPSAKRGELATAIQRGTDELRTIGHEVTVTKAFGKLGMLAVKGIPVVGPVIDAAKELSQGLIDRENRERQRRLQDYVLGVVRDEQYNDTVEFREEDVIPVIRKLAADDETAKTEYYTPPDRITGPYSPQCHAGRSALPLYPSGELANLLSDSVCPGA
ncbi:hypothetical protein NKF23_000784 [Salmonella enterica]|nr:hypothetical protein [Salmonella enterica]